VSPSELFQALHDVSTVRSVVLSAMQSCPTALSQGSWHEIRASYPGCVTRHAGPDAAVTALCLAATSLTWKRFSRGCRRPLEPSAAASRRFTTCAFTAQHSTGQDRTQHSKLSPSSSCQALTKPHLRDQCCCGVPPPICPPVVPIPLCKLLSWVSSCCHHCRPIKQPQVLVELTAACPTASGACVLPAHLQGDLGAPTQGRLHLLWPRKVRQALPPHGLPVNLARQAHTTTAWCEVQAASCSRPRDPDKDRGAPPKQQACRAQAELEDPPNSARRPRPHMVIACQRARPAADTPPPHPPTQTHKSPPATTPHTS